jgi:hypothetical protein
VNVVYDVPIGTGRRFATSNKVMDYIIGGWQVNTIVQAHSGLPYNITADGDIANTGDTGYERAELVGNPNLSNRSAQEWFNTAAFAIPATYTYGNSGRNILRGPAFWNMDASLFRRFPFMEGKAFEFRAEAFNMPNTVILGQPGNDLTGANFGVITSTYGGANGYGSRIIQLGLKLTY